MIVVSDAAPLQYLVTIGIEEFLQCLYGDFYIPPAVLSELEHEHSPLKGWMREIDLIG